MIFPGFQTTYWSLAENDILIMDGYTDGWTVEFTTFYLPLGAIQFHYQATLNIQRKAMTGTFKQTVGAKADHGTFTATMN